jgi:hypothetical protein
MQVACLEALIRKALADGWAFGATQHEANRLAIRMAQEKFPKEPLREISKLIQRMREELA